MRVPPVRFSRLYSSAHLWRAAFRRSAGSAKVSPGTKPNLLVIFTDDQGWADLGAQGVDPDIRTPHTDQLARDGVRFTRGYVTGPQCVPSRAGLITGTHQNRFGVDDNLKGPCRSKSPLCRSGSNEPVTSTA
jgi:arylsulfatase A-like enzyme